MIDSDLDACRILAEDAGEEPSHREAQDGDFGFCVYGDGPAALGGGTPWFYWFETKLALLSFLNDHALFLHPVQFLNAAKDQSLAKIEEAVRRAISEFGNIDLETLRLRLNEHLKGGSQFSWLGSFESLRESDHPEAKTIRDDFRAHNETPEGSSPVNKLEAQAFSEFLLDYGV